MYVHYRKIEKYKTHVIPPHRNDQQTSLYFEAFFFPTSTAFFPPLCLFHDIIHILVDLFLKDIKIFRVQMHPLHRAFCLLSGSKFSFFLTNFHVTIPYSYFYLTQNFSEGKNYLI